MKCPKCDSKNYRKDGIVQERQRYKCKECNYRYSVQHRVQKVAPQKKRVAIFLFLEGYRPKEISELLGVSAVGVKKWIDKYLMESEVIISKKQPNPTTHNTYELRKILNEKRSQKGFLLIDLEKHESVLIKDNGAPLNVKQ